MTCQAFDDRPKPRRGGGKRSVFAVVAEREALKDRTIASYAATITEQAQQIADLKRRLAKSVNRARAQK